MSEAPKIGILIPSQDTFKARTGVALAGLVHQSVLSGLNVFVMGMEGATVSKARNNLTRNALAAGADFLFFLDSDMIVPPESLAVLVKHDKDIAAITYNKRAHPYETLGHLKGPERDVTQGGLFEANFMPGGAMLIKAEVMKTLGYPWFFESYFWQSSSVEGAFIKMLADWSLVEMPLSIRNRLANDPEILVWLDENEQARKGFADGVDMISEDYNFCKRAVRHGFKIWCDMDLTFKTGHIGNQIVTCVPPPTEILEAAE